MQILLSLRQSCHTLNIYFLPTISHNEQYIKFNINEYNIIILLYLSYFFSNKECYNNSILKIQAFIGFESCRNLSKQNNNDALFSEKVILIIDTNCSKYHTGDLNKHTYSFKYTQKTYLHAYNNYF